MGTKERIAKNSVIMFVRMIVLMGISFYLSRYLLAELGITDFGILSVVGSVLATFTSLKSLFSESVQRFINFEKGKDNADNVRTVFNMSVVIHVVLAIAFFVVVEIIGLYLIYNKLEIPSERVGAALWVFHYSTAAAVFSILCIPYDALIIANEKLGFFAFLSIFDGLLKLCGAVLLSFLPYDMLKGWGVVLFLLPVVNLTADYIYCRRFPESTLKKSWDKGLFRGLFSLTSWNFFGNISFSLIHEGINVLFNILGGVVYNAARSIAYQVRTLVTQMTNNIMVPVRPLVMQRASSKSSDYLSDIIIKISRITYAVVFCLVIPIILLCDELLNIWLKDVPPKAVLLTQLILLASLFRTLHEPLNMFQMAVGRLKRMMILESFIMLLTLIIVYILFLIGFSMYIAFITLIIMELVIIISLSINGMYEGGFTTRKYLQEVLIPLLSMTIICLLILFGIKHVLPVIGIVIKGFFFLLSFAFCALCCFIIANRSEKLQLKGMIKKYTLGHR